MEKPLLLSSCFAVALMLSPSLQADTEAMPVYDLDPMVIVAPNLWIPEVEVFRDTISSAKPVDLAAILSSQLPAAALTRKGPLAGDIVLRGFTRDNVVITVDDNQTFCACPNRMDPPAFHVSSQQIEGISVRTGPFSLDQGASVGGAIAVRTTAPSDEAFARIYGYAGSFDYYAAGFTGGYAFTPSLSTLGGFYYQTGGVYEDGDGILFTEIPGSNYLPAYRDDKAFEVFTAEAKAALTLDDESTLTLNYALQDAMDVLYPGLLMDAPTDTMNRASLAYRKPLDAAWTDAIEVSLAFSHVDHDMTDAFRSSLNNMGGAFADRGYFMRTEAESAFIGGRLEFNKMLGDRELIRYGFEAKRRYWDANNIIGNQTNDMLPDTINDTLGIWGVYERRSGPWAFESGARLDFARSKAREDLSFLQTTLGISSNEQDDVLPSFYGLISRDITPGLNAYAGLGYGTRMPDPQERYMNLNRPMSNPDWVGNPDLDPVGNLEIQSGVRWRKDGFGAEFNAFHAWLFDTIYLTRLDLGPGGATSYQNIDARIYGFSADASWKAAESLSFEAGIAWQEGVKESLPNNATNHALAEVPPLRGRLGAIFTRGAFTVRAEGQFQDTLDRIDPDLGERTIDGWLVLNLIASYRLNHALSFSAGVDNLLDETYAVANAFVRDPFRSGKIVNEPGRFLFLRAGWEF